MLSSLWSNLWLSTHLADVSTKNRAADAIHHLLDVQPEADMPTPFQGQLQALRLTLDGLPDAEKQRWAPHLQSHHPEYLALSESIDMSLSRIMQAAAQKLEGKPFDEVVATAAEAQQLFNLLTGAHVRVRSW